MKRNLSQLYMDFPLQFNISSLTSPHRTLDLLPRKNPHHFTHLWNLFHLENLIKWFIYNWGKSFKRSREDVRITSVCNNKPSVDDIRKNVHRKTFFSVKWWSDRNKLPDFSGKIVWEVFHVRCAHDMSALTSFRTQFTQAPSTAGNENRSGTFKIGFSPNSVICLFGRMPESTDVTQLRNVNSELED